ncbi:hypothetical protein R1flu_019479 [Riccia fluitans]|uniref:Agenet-like domain-containing protein n=1 Tax=Riccia fluitans TaxID=41844 RepID=A0ABD1ZKY3_9MARC
MMETLLTFTIGREVESKSHAQGYRGAWFRCRIEDIDRGGRGQLRFKLRYLNFPDEALHWSQAYQQKQRGNAATFELMLRPPMPPVVTEHDFPDVMYDGLAVVIRPWEVGDLVNFWCDDVWWECFVSDILDQETVKVSLFKPPLGEGGQHIVKGKALRPSLVWTLADGWSVPLSKKNSQCSRLVRLSAGLPKSPNSPLKREKATFLGETPNQLSSYLLGNGHNQLAGTLRMEDQAFYCINSTGMLVSIKKVPDLSALRTIVEPLVCRNERREADSNISDGTEVIEPVEIRRMKLNSKVLSQKKIGKYRKYIDRVVKMTRRSRITSELKRSRRSKRSAERLCRVYMRRFKLSHKI